MDALPVPAYTTDTLIVVIPAYNAAPYIRESVDSMLAQTFTEFDLLFIDDCSTDDTAIIIESYVDPRVHLVRRAQNGGVVPALNSGLELVRHKFLARMDADDRSTPDRFQKQMDYLLSHPAIDVVGAHLRNFGVEAAEWNYPLTHNAIKASFLFGNTFPHASLMARAEVFKVERYSKRVVHMEDYELWLRLIPKHRFATLPDRLYEYRRHDEAVTMGSKNDHRERLKLLLVQPMGWLDLTPNANELSILAFDDHGLPGGYADHLETAAALFSKIRKANKMTKVFDPASLDQVLEEKWERLFYKLAGAQPAAWIKYWKLSGGIKGAQLRYAAGALKQRLF